MRPLRRLLYSIAIVAPLLTLPGCLITTQSFNHGKLLNPGERLATHAFGWRYSTRCIPPRDSHAVGFDEYGYSYPLNRTVRDPPRLGWFTYTYDYRVGVLRKYPLGKGLETGYHLEVAFRGDPHDVIEFYGPPVLEIDTRFGLPDITLRKCIFHHNVNAGWMVGYWIDNGWFLGYAAGWEFDHCIPYVSSRLFLTATDARDKSPDDTSYFTKHDRTWGGRIACGISLRLPFNFSWVPEFITPECSFAFPNYSTGQHVGFNASLGIRWMLGQ